MATLSTKQCFVSFLISSDNFLNFGFFDKLLLIINLFKGLLSRSFISSLLTKEIPIVKSFCSVILYKNILKIINKIKNELKLKYFSDSFILLVIILENTLSSVFFW